LSSCSSSLLFSFSVMSVPVELYPIVFVLLLYLLVPASFPNMIHADSMSCRCSSSMYVVVSFVIECFLSVYILVPSVCLNVT